MDRPDLTVTGPRRRVWCWLQKDGSVLRAYHQRGDTPGRQSCSHCGLGQVPFRVGATCVVCRAVVVEVSEGRPGQGQLQLDD